MKTSILIAITVLVMFATSAAMATTLDWMITPFGSNIIYTYTLNSTEYGDRITSLHLYAALSPSRIVSWTAPDGWLFDAVPDPDAGRDIFWYVSDTSTEGLANLASMTVSLTVTSMSATESDYILPGCLSNWGYETANWLEWGVLIDPNGPVPVPVDTPEPITLVSLLAGCGSLIFFRRK